MGGMVTLQKLQHLDRKKVDSGGQQETRVQLFLIKWELDQRTGENNFNQDQQV